MTPKLKICGVNDSSFAVEAARLGADFLGFIFAGASPRSVTPEEAGAIRAQVLAALGGEDRPLFAGVFTDTPVDEIAATAALVPLDTIQLHGDYGDEDAMMLKRLGLEVWRLHPFGGTIADAVLVDGSDGVRRGGTGRLADWPAVDGLKRRGLRVVLAGGLSAANIEAAAATGADVLDVNSSLETSSGVKSVRLLHDFFARFAPLRRARRCRGEGHML